MSIKDENPLKTKPMIYQNKFYLKKEITIDCATIINNQISIKHTTLKLNNTINLLQVNQQEHHFIFEHNNIIYIYWCDLNIFMDIHCKKLPQIRKEKLQIIKNNY